jgi:hypothetical protein
MTNTNCLEGIACPKCGHTGSFHIEAVVRLHVTDSGSEDPGGDHYWDAYSDCMCGNRECDQQGPFQEFWIANQAPKGGAA